MPSHFDRITARLRAAWASSHPAAPQPTTRRAFRCQCGKPVFFRNSQCLHCQTPLGYDPARCEVLPLCAAPPEPETGVLLWQPFRPADGTQHYQRCANFETAAGCNWLVPREAPPAAGTEQSEATAPLLLCPACRLNRTIPDLTVPGNAERWAQLERAKRRLVSQLIALGLPVLPKTEDPEGGLAFDFLGRVADGPAVMTGHASGLITLNIEEADDPVREKVRADMREPYRTLLGHFRHEIGHYYWDRLIAGSGWLPHFRQLFGDDRQDYAAALKSNYEQGAPADWPQRFVSAYASSHPWEDWAETWAHYLHMVDTVDTALSFGIDVDDVELDADPWGPSALWLPGDAGAQAFLDFLNAWVELTAVVNEMSRSMGQHDFYPFVLPNAAVRKLQFIHLVVRGATPPPAPPEASAEPPTDTVPAAQPVATAPA